MSQEHEQASQRQRGWSQTDFLSKRLDGLRYFGTVEFTPRRNEILGTPLRGPVV